MTRVACDGGRILRAGCSDRPRWVIALGFVSACGIGGDADPGKDATALLPRMVEAPLPAAERPAPDVRSFVVVGNDGVVAIPGGELREAAFVVVGDSHAGPREYGRSGEGPGEMRLAIPLTVDDTTVVGYDLTTARLMTFDRTSTQIVRELRLDRPIHPFMRGPGNTYIGMQVDRQVTSPFLIDRASGSVRPVIAPSDTFRIGLFANDVVTPGGTENTAVVGRWSDGVLLANGMNYRLGLYDLRGNLTHRIERNIAPRRLTPAEIEAHLARLEGTPVGNTPARLARARERLEARPTRWFTHTGAPRSDGRGRLWVMLNYGDSTAADVFNGDQLLGRIRLDCPGFSSRWDLSGSWLVMLCVPSDPAAEYDAEVRRWRIVD